MAWKNLTQTSLADDLVHQHQAITELDDLNELVPQLETMISGLLPMLVH